MINVPTLFVIATITAFLLTGVDTKFVFSYRVKGIAAPSIKLEKDYVEITKALDGDRVILLEIARERNRFANNYCMEAE